MVEIAELTSQDTLRLPTEIAARFRPTDRFVIWVEGDTLHLKRITPPAATDIVAYEITKENLTTLLEERPAIAEEMARVVAERRVRTAERKEAALNASEAEEEVRGLADALLDKMRNLFGLGRGKAK